MKNLWVASDIEGSFDELSTEEKVMFITKLEEYKNKKGIDNIYFSFISSLDCSNIRNFVDVQLKPLLAVTKSGIKIGPQFGFDGYFFEDNIVHNDKLFNMCKGVQMANVFHDQKHFFKENITELIYIDDNPNLNPSFLLMRLSLNNAEIDKVSIIVKDDGYDIREAEYEFEVETIKDNSRNFMLDGMDDLLKVELNIEKVKG